MKVLGITGPSGAGKGEISARLTRHYGIPVLDADAIYHALLIPPSPCLDALVAAFGDAILAPDGTLCRKTLSAIVFSDTEKRRLLNSIAHRHVMEEIRRRLRALAEEGCPVAAIDAPQLFEAGADADCDYVLAVLASPAVRRARIQSRDGITEAQANARFAAQHGDDFFRTHADAVIENDGTTDALFDALNSVLCDWEVCSE